jgi:hypothetical protein
MAIELKKKKKKTTNVEQVEAKMEINVQLIEM